MSNTKPAAQPAIQRAPLSQRFAAWMIAIVRNTCARVSFLVRLFPFLCKLYPDATYLVAKRPQSAAAASQLGGVAQGLSSVAQTVNDVYHALPRKEENFNWVIDTMQASLCDNCARRARCWGNHYSDVMDALYALKPVLQQTDHVGVEHFSAGLSHCVHPAAMASEMTRAYTLYRSKNQARMQSDALRVALMEQYGALAEALEGLSGQLSAQGTLEHYKTRRVLERFTCLGMPPSECAVTQEGNGQLRIAITLPRKTFTEGELHALAQEVARACQRKIAVPQKLSCGGVTTLIFHEKPVLTPLFGIAAQPAKGAISGDAVQQFCHANCAQMILCDGMGTGRPAAVDGNLAAELTARLLKSGFTAQTAARLVNIALTLKSDEESSATLDLMSVDLYSGAAQVFKAGAAPGFVVQGGVARVIGADSLPVGILGEVKAAESTLQLQSGDVAVLVSDGMLTYGEGWILDYITRAVAAHQPPQNIADLLVLTACTRAQQDATAHPDDITAAVLQVI